MATKIWTTKADFDTGNLSNVVDHRNDDLQLACAWSTGGDLNTARWVLGGCGTQTAGLSFGGYTDSSCAVTEEYGGTCWSSGGDLNTVIYGHAGCGTQTAGLSFGGVGPSAVTEEYNGSCWSSGGDLNTANIDLAGCGTQTAGLSIGGYNAGDLATSEEYNGTCWSLGGDLNLARNHFSGCGTQTASLAFGQENFLSSVEEYNGSSWSSGGDLNIGRGSNGGAGTQTAGLCFGGYDGGDNTAITEEYNGNSWSYGGDLNTARRGLSGCGIQNSALSFGGYISSVSAITEEYNTVVSGTWTVDFDSGDAASWGNLSWINTGGGSVKARVKSATSQGNLDGATWYPCGSWITAADLNSGRGECTATGSQSAAVTCGGWSGVVQLTEEYNGTSWCTGGDLNVPRRRRPGGGGTQTAAFSVGGYSGIGYLNTSEEYNGTSWCSSGNISQVKAYLAGCGTLLAGLCFGGLVTPPFSNPTNRTEEFDGTSWSLGGNLITAKGMLGGSGSSIDAISVGGWTGSELKKCETYDGIIWTSQVDVNSSVRSGLCGGSNGALSFGGGTSQITTEEYNGSAWTIMSDCIVGLYYKGDAGTTGAALSVSGGTNVVSKSCEEYNTQPVDVECPDNQWYRLEVTLVEGSTPEVQQVSQEYQLPSPGEEITANAEICLNVPLYADGRIQPIITANGRIKPSIISDGRIQPTISANSNIVCPRQFGGNWQRKCWYFAPYFWRSRYDIINNRLIFEYIHENQLDGDNWAENINARIDASGFSGIDAADFTVRGKVDGEKTTIHYSDGTDTYISEADNEVTNPITWSWANTTKAFDGVADSCNYKQVNLAKNRATVPYFHATAVFDDDTNYYVRDKKQTSSGDITGWNAAVNVSSNANTNIIYGSSVRSIGITGAAKNDMIYVWKEGGHLKGRYYNGALWAANTEQTIDATANASKARFDLEHCIFLGCKIGFVVYVDGDGTIKWSRRDNGPNSSESWSAPVTLCDSIEGHDSVGIVAHDEGVHYVLWKLYNHIEYRKFDDDSDIWSPALGEAASSWDPSTMGVVKTTTIFQIQTPDSIAIADSILVNWVGKIGADDCEIGWGVFKEGDNLEFIGANARIQPIITGNAEICLNVPLYANARIQPIITVNGRIKPSISADGRIQPIITANGRIQPVISSNAEICLNVPLYAVARIQPCISSNAEICLNVPLYAVARIQPVISSNAEIYSNTLLYANARIQPVISSNAEICSNVPLYAIARIQPVISSNAEICLNVPLYADGRIQPAISSNAEICLNVPLYAVARIQPCISSNAEICLNVPLYAVARIQPCISSNAEIYSNTLLYANARIQPVISSNAEICSNVSLYAIARIQPVISSNAEICLNVPLYADGRIQPAISSNAEICLNVPLYAVARIQLCISSNAEICLNVPLYTVARIQPCISSTGRIRPIITSNGEIVGNVPLYAVARIQSVISSTGRISPIITSNGEIVGNVPLYAVARIQSVISSTGRISPIITSNGEIVGNVPLYAVARIQPCISSNAEICLNVPLYAVARIQPSILSNAEILTDGGNKIIVVGGGNYYDLCELYDQWLDTWWIKTKIPTGRADSASGYIRGKRHFIRIKYINTNSRIRPVIVSNGKIVGNVPNLCAMARIQPVISAIGRIRPVIESNGRVRPSIPSVAKIQGTIRADGRVRPIITGLSRIIPTIMSKGRVRPIITALGKIVENTSINSIARICYAKFGYGLIANSHIIARILKRISSNARIRLIIVAVASIRPAIKANGRIRPVITALARIFPGITSKGRIRPVMTAQSRIRPIIPAVAKIRPTIGGNAKIVYVIKAVARIQPSIKTDGKIKIPKTANISGSAYIRMAWVGGEGFPIYNDVGY